jgi:hypothetical protein
MKEDEDANGTVVVVNNVVDGVRKDATTSTSSEGTRFANIFNCLGIRN